MTETPAFAPLSPSPPPPGPQPRNPLRRTRDNRVVAGVCGGLGRATGVDPVVFRVVVAILAVFGGAGILLYLIAWALIPEEGVQESWLEQFTRRHGTGVVIALGVLAALLLLPAAFGWGFDGGWPFRADFGLLLLIAAIAGIVWVTRRSNSAATPVPHPSRRLGLAASGRLTSANPGDRRACDQPWLLTAPPARTGRRRRRRTSPRFPLRRRCPRASAPRSG